MSCGPRDGTGRRGSVTSTATRFAPSNPPPTELVLKPTLVMPNHAQFTVNIVVDDVPLEEFEGNRKDNVYSCWIASEEGKNFTVRWTVKPSNEAFTCSIFMDGSFVKAHVYKPVRSLVEDNIRGCTVNANTIRLFAFSRVSLTDDDAIASADQMLSDLGTIEIKIHRVEILGSFDRTFNTEGSDQKISNCSVIHERSKKMSMHHITTHKNFSNEGHQHERYRKW